jgi:NHL repeat
MRAHFQLFCMALLLFASGYAQSVGDITTVAGTGTGGFSGDGGLSISAQTYQAYGVAVDKAGNFYIADTGNNRIRKVNISNYIITTVAGNGKPGFCGDWGAATGACLTQPTESAQLLFDLESPDHSGRASLNIRASYGSRSTDRRMNVHNIPASKSEQIEDLHSAHRAVAEK